MAKFEGSVKEYHKFIGPSIKNKIQSITKKEKNKIGNVCEECKKKKDELDAAHKHGTDRKSVIELVLKKRGFLSNNLIKIDDIQKAEDLIIQEHIPIKKYVRFLCKQCHNEYDKRP